MRKQFIIFLTVFLLCSACTPKTEITQNTSESSIISTNQKTDTTTQTIMTSSITLSSVVTQDDEPYTTSPTEQELPIEIEATLDGLLTSGDVQTYSFFIHADPVYEIEAFRTLLPLGWQGSGAVNWDYASSSAPARTNFVAISPDGYAGFARTTDIHYVEQIYSGAYDSSTIASSDGIPLRSPCTAIEMAYEIPPTIMSGLSDIHVTGSENADPEGILDRYYKQVLSPNLEAVTAYGGNYRDLYCTMDSVSGTASVNGSPIEFTAYITICGYTLQSSGNYITITSNYWSVLNTMFCFAPPNQLGDYANEFDIISSNFTDNANWISLRNNVTESLLGMLREQQLQNWAQANAFSEALYARYYATYPKTGDYSSSSSGSIFDEAGSSSSSIFESWEETLTGRETYDLGSQGTMTVDGFYDKMWSDGSGNFIGSNNGAYDPGYGWNQVYTVTE